MLDVLWNLVFVGSGFSVLGLSLSEKPSVPLRLWVSCYVVQCLVHMGCVVAEYRRRRVGDTVVFESGRSWESGRDWSSSSGSDDEDYAAEQSEADDDSW